ncbi:TRAP transporter large permease subunit [Roseibium salinum]|nr:TRAP transporter large permease subunit [Roseibium salinum]
MIAASTGIIGATIVMLGTITLPALLSAGVNKHMSSGLICASGTLGQIIPPSIILILLGDQVSNAYFEAQQEAGNFAPDPVTVGDLFAGALFPGLLLVALYAAYVVLRLRRTASRDLSQQPVKKASALKLTGNIAPTLGLIVAVLGSILIGVATPTEAAGVGVAGAMLIAAASRGGRSAWAASVCAVLAVLLLILRQSGLFGLEFFGWPYRLVRHLAGLHSPERDRLRAPGGLGIVAPARGCPAARPARNRGDHGHDFSAL